MLMAVLLLQAAPAPLRRFDLKPVVGDGDCPATDGDGGEIVVCGGRTGERYRLRPIDDARYAKPSRAETGVVGDLRAAAEVEAAQIAPGVQSNRMMLRFKLPF